MGFLYPPCGFAFRTDPLLCLMLLHVEHQKLHFWVVPCTFYSGALLGANVGQIQTQLNNLSTN